MANTYLVYWRVQSQSQIHSSNLDYERASFEYIYVELQLFQQASAIINK